MPDSLPIDKLRLAIAAEKAETARRKADYKKLLAKMKAYQSGVGPEPSVEELERWRKGVDRQVAERKLESGFGDL